MSASKLQSEVVAQREPLSFGKLAILLELISRCAEGDLPPLAFWCGSTFRHVVSLRNPESELGFLSSAACRALMTPGASDEGAPAGAAGLW